MDLNESKSDKTENTSKAFEEILIQLIILQEHSQPANGRRSQPLEYHSSSRNL